MSYKNRKYFVFPSLECAQNLVFSPPTLEDFWRFYEPGAAYEWSHGSMPQELLDRGWCPGLWKERWLPTGWAGEACAICDLPLVGNNLCDNCIGRLVQHQLEIEVLDWDVNPIPRDEVSRGRYAYRNAPGLAPTTQGA